MSPDIVVGVGLGAPFGLKTEYDSTWKGRTQAIKSELKTININPSIAWKASESLSLGAGVSFQYAEATLTNFAGAPGVATVEGDDTGWGFNLGALWQLSEAMRIGFAYRSVADQSLESLDGSSGRKGSSRRATRPAISACSPRSRATAWTTVRCAASGSVPKRSAIDSERSRLREAERVSLANSVLGNLLTNAVKFSHPGGTVEVRAAGPGDAAAAVPVDSAAVTGTASTRPRRPVASSCNDARAVFITPFLA